MSQKKNPQKKQLGETIHVSAVLLSAYTKIQKNTKVVSRSILFFSHITVSVKMACHSYLLHYISESLKNTQ